MMSDITGVLITDGHNSVFIHPPEPYPDLYGYTHRVDFVAGRFSGSIDASSYENVLALRTFSREIMVLYRDLKGEASLSNAYSNFQLSLIGDGREHIRVEILARDEELLHCHLTFEFIIDQTQLPGIASALDKLVSPL